MIGEEEFDIVGCVGHAFETEIDGIKRNCGLKGKGKASANRPEVTCNPAKNMVACMRRGSVLLKVDCAFGENVRGSK